MPGQGVWGALAAWLHRREIEDAPPAPLAKVDALAADARRRRDEAALFEYLDNLPAGVFSANPEGRILYANRTLAGWLGVDVATLTGRPFADFVLAAEALPTAEDGVERGRVVLRRADGADFPALLAQTRRDGADGGVLYTRSLVLKDLGPVPAPAPSEARPESEDRPRWLFEEAPVGIALLDLAGVVTDSNRAFLKLVGQERDAVVGRPLAELLAMEDRGDIAAQLSKLVMGVGPAAHLEIRLPGAGPRETAASVYASRIEDPAGEVSGLILHFIDTSEQKLLEVQFAQAQKMQAIGQLAGGVAHDFNNLLTAMIGFSDLLLARHGPDDPSFADIMQIKQNANRATNLVRQLLAFSRKQTLKPIVLDPSEALSDLSHLLSRLIGPKIELRIEHGRDLGLIRVDRGQFDQVIINLAVNARDAMPGGGTLAIRTSNVAIDRPVQRGPDLVPAGAYLLIEVADTGVGIPKENLERIFEPFFSTKDAGAGTGLGLATVHGILHQTGGFIFVDSAVGEGTTFSIYLPVFEEREGATAAKAPISARPVEGDLTGVGTVLLVEDEDAVRLFGARALKNKGYRVLEAANGEAALDVINGALSEGAHIDLIVSDVVMPGMDGHTLVRLVRQELPEVKIILMSGYAEDVAEEVARDPAIHFLAKPFSLAGLAGKVKEVLRG
jgi:two-component system cell cycle sensor histidine kinase/response regulator CckA